jgi:8-oxo-dGTP diphosphatase
LIGMTYEKVPETFNPRFEVVSCFIERDGKILILRRGDDKSQGGKWGLPAGKVDNGEDLKKAIVREVEEETGLKIPEENLHYFGKTFHNHDGLNFVFHMFSAPFAEFSEVKINTHEHREFLWKTPPEVLALPTKEKVEDFDYTIKFVYGL